MRVPHRPGPVTLTDGKLPAVSAAGPINRARRLGLDWQMVCQEAARRAQEVVMALPGVVTRQPWLRARLWRPAGKPELAGRRGALDAERRRPMVRDGQDCLLGGRRRR